MPQSPWSPPTRAPHAAPVNRPRVRRLRLVAAGYANPEIGDELNLSLSTVPSCLREMMHELAARNRAQLIANAVRPACCEVYVGAEVLLTFESFSAHARWCPDARRLYRRPGKSWCRKAHGNRTWHGSQEGSDITCVFGNSAAPGSPCQRSATGPGG
ncbi:helix-turn-helix transcriptional regulator [Streptomyces canus]|uniref:helix-turn-helix domain-containing protein n=1 Tax=Streptomyces canus TaxID=58343 RepID=UPI003722158D